MFMIMRKYYRGLKNGILYVFDISYDSLRFLRFSGVWAVDRKKVSQSKILKEYHRLEKGLSLKVPKPGFGKEVAMLLCTELHKYVSTYGGDEIVDAAVSTLSEYLKFIKGNGQFSDNLVAIDLFVSSYTFTNLDGENFGGVFSITSSEITKHGCLDNPLGFFHSRYSIRNFSNKDVAVEKVKYALKLASKTPSVCNRQSSKVYMLKDPVKIEKALDHQNGNSGFGDGIKILLILSYSLESMLLTGERNQGWVDGGMYAMSLIYALHSLGLGTCCLNWSADKNQDKDFRRVFDIPASEPILMMIGIGAIPDTLYVAKSKRLDINEVVTEL